MTILLRDWAPPSQLKTKQYRTATPSVRRERDVSVYRRVRSHVGLNPDPNRTTRSGVRESDDDPVVAVRLVANVSHSRLSGGGGWSNRVELLRWGGGVRPGTARPPNERACPRRDARRLRASAFAPERAFDAGRAGAYARVTDPKHRPDRGQTDCGARRPATILPHNRNNNDVPTFSTCTYAACTRMC